MPDSNSLQHTIESVLVSERWSKLYAQRLFDQLSEDILKTFSSISSQALLAADTKFLSLLDRFVRHFLDIFCQPNYQVSNKYAAWFVHFNELVSNMTYLSSLRSTDQHLQSLFNGEHNLAKILCLYSARNHCQIDLLALYEKAPELISRWYARYLDLYISGLANASSQRSLLEHMRRLHPKQHWREMINEAYYGSTYIDSELDREVKFSINQALKVPSKKLPVVSSENKRRLALISGCWGPWHSVYRNQIDLLQGLQGKFDLTLVALRPGQECNLFPQVIEMHDQNNIDFEEIARREFAVIYYPDIGMGEASIRLANRRLAPIQITAFGHSVSTHGAEIDYYISGEAVEDLTSCKQNYSERLALLPGLGLSNKLPNYVRKNCAKSTPRFLINCAWSSQKCTHQMLLCLKEIQNQVSKPVLYRFFPSGGVLRHFGFLAFCADLRSVLGAENVEIIPVKDYPGYMELLEQADLALDSYHYGGCNSVFDALYLAKPIITWEGKYWYNRIGPAQLRAIGLHELIAQNQDQYIALAVKLIEQDEYRDQVAARIRAIDLANSTLCKHDLGKDFLRLICFLIDNDRELKAQNSKDPILPAKYMAGLVAA